LKSYKTQANQRIKQARVTESPQHTFDDQLFASHPFVFEHVLHKAYKDQ